MRVRGALNHLHGDPNPAALPERGSFDQGVHA